MAATILLHLSNLWPFSILKPDDLKLSNQLLRRLSIPEQTKQFVFAVPEPDSNSVVYVLAAQNLSEESAIDAEYLIKEVKPKAVVAQVTSSALTEIQFEKASSDDQLSSIPTSSLGVLMRCLTDKINKEQYDKLAGCQVLKRNFWDWIYGHFFAAKKSAEEARSLFLLLESPYESGCVGQPPLDTATTGDKISVLNLQPACLIPGKGTTSFSNSHRICLTDTLQSQMVKLLVPSLESLLQKKSLSDSVSYAKSCEGQTVYDNYEAPPPFAQSVYPLLVDLNDIFNDLPALRKALVSAQEMLANVNRGEAVSTRLLSEVHIFRIAIEGLRIALNNAARCPISKMENVKSEGRLEFSQLSSEEKCHALFAHAIRSQARKFGAPIVAIVDAGRLAGLRRHWRTSVPPEAAELADQCVTHPFTDDYLDDDDDTDEGEDALMGQHNDKKGLLADKPMVAFGAGATAVIGATSLSKAVPTTTLVKITTYKFPVVFKFGLTNLRRQAYIGLGKFLGSSKFLVPGVASSGTKTSATLVKITTYKFPAVFKFGLTNLQRQAYIGLGKFLGSSKFLAPGVASSGTKTSATLKLTASAEKIRAVTHSMIGYGERTSLLAIRTSFYEIMRRRHVGSFRVAPWATFSCSVAACSGLLMYGDGIECAAESIPSAPTIASLGRGLQSLQQASQEVKQTSSAKIKEALQSLMHTLKKK